MNVNQARKQAAELIERSGLFLTEEEKAQLEVVDFGLGDLENYGVQLHTYVNTDRVCAKELIMFPRQTCAEHWHPPVGDNPGKEETFRCRWGTLYLYVEGTPTPAGQAHAHPPAGREDAFTVFREVVLRPGDQYTLMPGIKHWFQGGEDGCVVSEFSTRSTDENDLFTDPAVVRDPMT